MGSGEVAIVALSTMISLKVTFSDGLGGGVQSSLFSYISKKIVDYESNDKFYSCLLTVTYRYDRGTKIRLRN